MSETLTEAEVKAKAQEHYVQRLRESGVSSAATLAGLAPWERSVAGRALAEAQALEVQLRGGAKMRESGGQRVELLQLDGVPLVDGAAGGSFEMPAEAPDGGGLLLLDGIPLAPDFDFAQASAEFSAMRESERAAAADDDDDALLVLEGIPLRESSYGGENGTDEIYSEGPELLPLLKDLYTTLPEKLPTGGPNVQNEVVKRMIEDIEKGHPLPAVDLAMVKTLVTEHGDAIKQLRAKTGADRQDYTAPSPDGGRVVTDADRDTGLLDLGDLRKTPVAA